MLFAVLIISCSTSSGVFNLGFQGIKLDSAILNNLKPISKSVFSFYLIILSPARSIRSFPISKILLKPALYELEFSCVSSSS